MRLVHFAAIIAVVGALKAELDRVHVRLHGLERAEIELDRRRIDVGDHSRAGAVATPAQIGKTGLEAGARQAVTVQHRLFGRVADQPRLRIARAAIGQDRADGDRAEAELHQPRQRLGILVEASRNPDRIGQLQSADSRCEPPVGDAQPARGPPPRKPAAQRELAELVRRLAGKGEQNRAEKAFVECAVAHDPSLRRRRGDRHAGGQKPLSSCSVMPVAFARKLKSTYFSTSAE